MCAPFADVWWLVNYAWFVSVNIDRVYPFRMNHTRQLLVLAVNFGCVVIEDVLLFFVCFGFVLVDYMLLHANFGLTFFRDRSVGRRESDRLFHTNKIFVIRLNIFLAHEQFMFIFLMKPM